MAKRKKYPRLPSSYGSISYLGKGRRNPYMVRPPVSEYDENGKAVRPKPICYTATWLAGFAALTAWKAGTYTPGSEIAFDTTPCENSSDVVERILSDYMRVTKRTDGLTFSEVYKAAYEWKFSHREIAPNTVKTYEQSYKRCKSLYDIPFASLRQGDLQKVIDDCDKSSATKAHIKVIMGLCYKYAIANDIVSTDYSQNIIVPTGETKHGQAFSDDELRYILNNLDDDDNKRILIMCLSGFRISAYKELEINFDDRYFKGGVKTAAGKDRIVPIHSYIYPIVKDLIDRKGCLGINKNDYKMTLVFRRVNPNATPHWARHTFSALCERFGVRENDRKRMLGHVVGDITNDVYGHRTLDDFKTEIEKIDVQKIIQQKDLGEKY